MSQYPPYPEYKASGVDWLGDVPAGWEVKKIRRQAFLITEKAAKSSNPVALENIEGWTGKFISSGSSFEGDGVSFKTGDILFGKLRPYLAKVYVAENPGEAVGDFHVLRFLLGTDSNFCGYLLRTPSFINTVSSSTYGAKMPRVNWDFLGSMGTPIPPLPEQEAIAAFLDRETGRIDELVHKKKCLIEKLKEQRTAVISAAVTKGLPPEVAPRFGLAPHSRFKASGVDWLGDVPEGWEVKRLSFILQNKNSQRVPISSTDRADVEKTYPYYGASGVIDYVENYIFDETTILVAEDGANLLSRSTPLAFLAHGKYWVNNHAHILSPYKDSIHYLAFLLLSFDYTPLVTGAAQPKLTKDNLSSIQLPLPPLPEQQAIAAYLDEQTATLDALVAKVEQAILALQEYRSTLITAAVTGKIDVRHAHPMQEKP